jgi:hypothetical protein
MNTFKNRNHRACANVEGFLNYTKLKYFWLHEVAERAVRREAKAGLERFLHSFRGRFLDGIVQKDNKFIAMNPLDCGGACSIPDRDDGLSRFCLRSA